MAANKAEKKQQGEEVINPPLKDDSPATLTAQQKSSDSKNDSEKVQKAELKAEEERKQAAVEKFEGDIEERHEQSAEQNKVVQRAEKRAERQDISLEESVAKDVEKDVPGSLDVLNRVEAGDVETPKADNAQFTPQREENTIELMTHAEGASAESRQLGTSAPTAATEAEAESLTNIADYYDIIRGVDLGVVKANDNSVSVTQTWFGQYQVRADGDLKVPTRKPDVETFHGEWWQEGEGPNGTFVGRPKNLEGVVYRIPRMVASVPSPSRVTYVDDATSEMVSEGRKVSEKYAKPEEETTDIGLGVSKRPPVVISPHLNHDFEGYDNSRSTLGGFTGRAIPVGSYVPPADTAQESYQEMLLRRFSPGFDPKGNSAEYVETRSAEELDRETQVGNGYDGLIKVGNHLQKFDPNGTPDQQNASENQAVEDARAEEERKSPATHRAGEDSERRARDERSLEEKSGQRKVVSTDNKNN